MPGIPKAKLDEWRRVASVEVFEPVPVAAQCKMLREAVPALLDEVERLTREVARLTPPAPTHEVVFDVGMDGIPRARLAEVPAAESEAESMRALLRQVEWGGCVTYDDGSGVLEVSESGCPCCRQGLQGSSVPASGHAPDCRLAAFLK